MSDYLILSRRELLASGLKVSIGSFVLGVAAKVSATDKSLFRPSVYIEIPTEGLIKIFVHRSEMGQNIKTTLVMMVAEELRVGYQQITMIQAPADPSFGDQNTDGSRSIRYNWLPMRLAGASAREALLQAAAIHWNTPPGGLIAENGSIIHRTDKKQMTYQELALKAAEVDLVELPPLLGKPGSFEKIGHDQANLELAEMVRGQTIYGMDVHQEGMLYACLWRCPTINGSITFYDAKEVLRQPGILTVVPLKAIGPSINTNASVAIVGSSSHAVLSARKWLKVSWQPGEGHGGSLDSQQQALKDIERDQNIERNEGDFDKLLTQGFDNYTARYQTPYLVHAPMEPLVATCVPYDNRLTIWAPSQDPMRAKVCVAEALSLSEQQVTLQVTHLGGGFGRKSQPDFVVEAAQVAWQLKKPVKLFWTREDEIRHGTYHAASVQHLTAVIDRAGGSVVGWRHRTSFPTIAKLFSKVYQGGPTSSELEMGHTTMPYQFDHCRAESMAMPSEIRVGWYRAVCHNFHAFAVECFVDELAMKLNSDPIDLRLKHLKVAPTARSYSALEYNPRRFVNTIETVRNLSNWQQQNSERHLGFACHYSFKTYVAMVVEVALTSNKDWRATKVFAAVDCGLVVNPDTVKAQVEGAVVFGLSQTYYGQITLNQGQIQQGNFDDYPILRLPEVPEIIVELIPSNEHPTGIGEPGLPPLAPALVNAIAKAVGRRYRSLPLYATQ